MTGTLKLRPLLLVLGALLLPVALSVLAPLAGGATQFNIVLQYDPSGDGVDPCADYEPDQPTCGHNADLDLIMQAVAQHWENTIEDNHEILIRYRWAEVSDPSAQIVGLNAAGQPTEAIVRIPVTFNFFYDTTPAVDQEFDMQGRLYRTLHPTEQAVAFQGDDPPPVYEVAYNGLQLNPLALDLVTIALHEVGHAIGLAGDVVEDRPVPPCTILDPWYDLDPAQTGDVDFEVRALDDDCAHLELGGITACKPIGDEPTTSPEPSTLPGLSIHECTAHQSLFWSGIYPSSRARPSVNDILVVAEAAGWQEINLPRKYSLASGLWHDEDTWLGDRIPDGDDDVYIVNQDAGPVMINSFDAGGIAENITITDGNTLNVFAHEFVIGNLLNLVGDGTHFTADTNSIVDGWDTRVGEGAILDVWLDGFFNSFYVTNFGEIRGGAGGNGVGTLDVVVLKNNGRIRGNGGVLRVTSTNIDPPFDLDGDVATAQIQALVGDIIFDGEITDPVLADIQVGPNHFITFSEGWTQQGSNVEGHGLTMSGGDFEATINGFSRLNGLLTVNQIARFTDDLELGEFARLHFDVGSMTPGLGHDQLNVDDDAALNGQIIVELTPDFEPVPNNRYTLLNYGSHTGAFAVETLPALDGGLQLLTDYGETGMDLVVGFGGADPDAPNCTGQAVANQVQEHGGMKAAAEALGYPSVKALQDAIDEFCDG